MIDITKPLELDDGTPMFLIDKSQTGDWLRATTIEGSNYVARDFTFDGNPYNPDADKSPAIYLKLNGRKLRNVNLSTYPREQKLKNGQTATIIAKHNDYEVAVIDHRAILFYEGHAQTDKGMTYPEAVDHSFAPNQTPEAELWDEIGEIDQIHILGLMVLGRKVDAIRYLRDNCGRYNKPGLTLLKSTVEKYYNK